MVRSDPYERAVMADYVSLCLRHESTPKQRIRFLLRIRDELLASSLPCEVDYDEYPNDRGRGRQGMPRLETGEYPKQSEAEWSRMVQDQLRVYPELAKKRALLRPSLLQRRLEQVQRLFGLSESDTEVLGLLVRYDVHPAVRALLSQLTESMRRCDREVTNLAIPLGIPEKLAMSRIVNSNLVRAGLIWIDSDGEVLIHGGLSLALRTGWRSEAELLRNVVGPVTKANLKWQHFDHVAEHRDHIEKVLMAALKKKAKGVNVLLYGAPGTGKTEFAKTLAKRLKVALYSVGESSGDARGRASMEEPSRTDRIGSVRLAQKMLGRGGGAMLLVDEASDLLEEFVNGDGGSFLNALLGRPARGSRASKIYINRTLEETPIPVIWVMNETRGLDSAIVRRFTYVFELPIPSVDARADVWHRLLRSSGFNLTKDEAAEFARRYEVAPAIAETAIKAAALAGRDLAAIHRTIASLQQAVTGKAPSVKSLMELKGEAAYDGELLVSSPDLQAVVKKLEKRARRRCSMLLVGKPGTGKSAFARELGKRIGKEVMQVRCSEMLDMWVGSTEKRIAAAFREARESGKLLVIDEADALLHSRTNARESWQVTQIAEMLTWLESHPIPLVFTVNSTESMDEASMRRFDLKVELKPLEGKTLERAWNVFFGSDAHERVRNRLLAMHGLTPGDFAVVARRARFEDLLPDVELDLPVGAENRPSSAKKGRTKTASKQASIAKKSTPPTVAQDGERDAALLDMLQHELEHKPGEARVIGGFRDLRR